MSGPIKMRVSDPLKTAWLDTSDFGNAKRLITIAGEALLWIEEVQGWAFYDGKRWAVERGNTEAQRFAHEVIALIRTEADALAEAMDEKSLKTRVGEWCTEEIAQKRIETLQSHAVRSGSAGMTNGMLKQARSLLSASLDEFDLDPLSYNVQNGTLRFFRVTDTGDGDRRWCVRLVAHEPTDRIMQIANCAYEPGAVAPFWAERLAMLTPDAEQLAAFQPLYGYTLTALTSDQAFYVHQGKGGDGKSATHMALADLHGDYYRHSGVNTFLQSTGQKSGSDHRSDLVRLAGDVRFVTCDEPPKRAVWDGAVIKQITGSMVTARESNARTDVTFAPRFKLHVECNNIPKAPSDDKGFRRRLKLYQHRVSLADMPDGEMPLDLVLERLADERSGVLNWLIAGAIEWLTTRKIPQPRAMADVLSDFWADSSPLLEWMSEWCDTSDPLVWTGSSELHKHFKDWCESAGIEPVMSTTAFGNALRDKQFPMKKHQRTGNRGRMGIALRTKGMFEGSGFDQKIAGSFGANREVDAGPAVPDQVLDANDPANWDDMP
jgi:putative DNA primase/helicase